MTLYSPSRIQLQNADLSAEFTQMGASLAQLTFRNQSVIRSIPLEQYAHSGSHFGSIAGPIANRVGGAKVSIAGQDYVLDANEQGKNTLHGGSQGLGRRPWQTQQVTQESVTFALTLNDGELGLPGQRRFECTYHLSEYNELKINLSMLTDQDSMCNLAFHPYFCLDNGRSILSHTLQVYADHYLPLGPSNCPTGELKSVADTAFDFRHKRGLAYLTNDNSPSIDHNFCFSKPDSELQTLATLFSPQSKVKMTIQSNQLGLQIYCPTEVGDPLNHAQTGDLYPAICLEPQGWPDSPNHHHFPSILVSNSSPYQQTSIFQFSHQE